MKRKVMVAFYGGRVPFWNVPLAVIQFGTDSEIYHVAPELSYPLFVDALFWKGVTVRNVLNVKIPKGNYIDLYQTKEELDFDAYTAFLESKIGMKYDKAGVFYLAWLKLKRDHHSSNKFQKDKDYFCSELAADALRAGKLSLPESPEGTVSPADLKRSGVLDFVRRME